MADINIKNSLLLLVAWMVLAAWPVYAAKPSVFYTYTSGSQSYSENEVSASLDLVRGFYVGAGFNSYSSDTTNGTFKTYAGRFGRYTDEGSWQLYGSVTPEVNTYKARKIGLDWFRWIWGREKHDDNPSKPKFGLNLGVARTAHQDGVQTLTDDPHGRGMGAPSFSMGDMGNGGSGMSNTQPRAMPIKINQNDLTAGLKVGIYKTTLGGGLTKSLYDEDLSGQFLRASRMSQVPGITPILQGYPDRSIYARVTQDILSWLWASGSYTDVKFKVGPEKAKSVGLGVGASWKRLEGSLDWSRYSPSNDSSRNYLSFGIGLRI